MTGLLWLRLLHFGHCNSHLCVQGTGWFKSANLVRFSYWTLAQDSKGSVLGPRTRDRHLQNSLCYRIWGWTKDTKYTQHEPFQRQLPLLPSTCNISQKGLLTALLSSHLSVLLISQFTGRKLSEYQAISVPRRWIFIPCLPLFIATLCRTKRAKYEEELSGRPACLEVQTGKDALLQDLSSVRQAGV